MDKIYIIGDIDTVTAFRLSGIEGIIADESSIANEFGNILNRDNISIVLIIRQLAEHISNLIYNTNLNINLD